MSVRPWRQLEAVEFAALRTRYPIVPVQRSCNQNNDPVMGRPVTELEFIPESDVEPS